MPAFVERTFRIKIGRQVLIVNMEEADDLIAGIRTLRDETEDAVSENVLVVDEDESAMSLRKVQLKRRHDGNHQLE